MTSLSSKLVIKVSPKSVKGYVPLKAKYSETSPIDDYVSEFGDFAKVSYRGYRMPGSNKEKTHDWCGTWKVMGCLNNSKHPEGKVYAKPVKRSCFKALCPVCKNAWLYREAHAATKRIDRYEMLSERKALHLVWSPSPNNPIIYEPLSVLRKACYSAMKEVGVEGGAVIFHAYRDREYNGFRQWYYSPHFHIIGFGWIEGTKEHHAKNNTVIVNLGTRDSVLATVVYQLSHCTIKQGKKNARHSLTWIGSLSYSKLSIPKEEADEQKCPYCYDNLVTLEFCDGYDPPPDGIEPGLFEKEMFCVVGVKDDYTREGIGSYYTPLVKT